MRQHPFPHTILQGVWDDGLLSRCAAEFPGPEHKSWIRYDNAWERKLAGGPRMWGSATHELMRQLASKQWVQRLEELTGIKGLLARTEGGGMHRIEPGGYLGIHADFNRSADGLYRRLNCLVFLNHDWQAEDGGALELWNADGPVVEILPHGNTTVVFETSDRSFHGHPTPLPGPKPRLSIAMYFFTEDAPEGASEVHSTIFI